MSAVLVQLAGIVALPFLLRKLSTAFQKKQTLLKLPVINPHSPYESWIKVLLIGIICLSAFQIWNKPVSFFDEIGCDIDAPNFVLRNKFREFVEIQETQSPDFTLIRHGLVSPRKDANETEFVSSLDYYTDLYESLKISEDRAMYLTFGPTIFSECKWCSSQYDYLIYNLPNLIFPFACALFALGIATSSPRRLYWRLYILFGLSTSLSLILIVTAVPWELYKEHSPNTKVPLFKWSHYLSHLGFILFSAFVYFNDTKPRDKSEVMKAAIANLHAILVQNDAIVLEGVVLPSDGTVEHEADHVGLRKSQRIHSAPLEKSLN